MAQHGHPLTSTPTCSAPPLYGVVKEKLNLSMFDPHVLHEARTTSSLASLFLMSFAGSRGRRTLNTAKQLIEMSKCRAIVTAAMQISAD